MSEDFHGPRWRDGDGILTARTRANASAATLIGDKMVRRARVFGLYSELCSEENTTKKGTPTPKARKKEPLTRNMPGSTDQGRLTTGSGA